MSLDATAPADSDAIKDWPADLRETRTAVNTNTDILDSIVDGTIYNGFSATSDSIVTIALGVEITFVIETGKLFIPAQPILFVDIADSDNWIWGKIVSYDTLTGILIMDSENTNGSGTHAGWIGAISLNPTGTVITIDTVANMKALTLDIGDVCYTQGYYAVNDGGEGTYLVTAGASFDGYIDHSINAGAATAVLRIDAELRLRQAGAVGDGVTDDYLPVAAWLSRVNTLGVAGFANDGIYEISTAISQTLTGDIEIRCNKNAIFRHAAGLTATLLTFVADTAELYGVTWTGGTIDASQSVFVSAEASGTCLGLKRLINCAITRATFYSGVNYEASTGDSGITLVDCFFTTIAENYFVGCPDAGIYMSGNQSVALTDDGGNTIVSGNQFLYCHVGVSSKRQHNMATIDGNSFYGCELGIITSPTNTDSVFIDPGQGMVITSNIFKRIATRAIELRYGTGHLVSNNWMEDVGYDLQGLAQTGWAHLRLMGATDSSVENNTFIQKIANPVSRAILIDDYTDVIAGLHVHSGNVVRNNRIVSLQASWTLAIEEKGTGGPNDFRGNSFTRVTTEVTTVHAQSVYSYWTGNGGVKHYVDNVEVFRIAEAGMSAASLRVIDSATAINGLRAKASVLDFGTVSAHSSTKLTSAVTGVDTDWVALINTSTDQYPSGIVWNTRCYADTVEIICTNVTAGNITLPSATFLVRAHIIG